MLSVASGAGRAPAASAARNADLLRAQAVVKTLNTPDLLRRCAGSESRLPLKERARYLHQLFSAGDRLAVGCVGPVPDAADATLAQDQPPVQALQMSASAGRGAATSAGATVRPVAGGFIVEHVPARRG